MPSRAGESALLLLLTTCWHRPSRCQPSILCRPSPNPCQPPSTRSSHPVDPVSMQQQPPQKLPYPLHLRRPVKSHCQMSCHVPSQARAVSGQQPRLMPLTPHSPTVPLRPAALSPPLEQMQVAASPTGTGRPHGTKTNQVPGHRSQCRRCLCLSWVASRAPAQVGPWPAQAIVTVASAFCGMMTRSGRWVLLPLLLCYGTAQQDWFGLLRVPCT